MSGLRGLAIAAVLLSSCYFETPTSAPVDASVDAADEVDESEAGLADGGMDADTEDADAESEDSGPTCACDAGNPICIVATGTCVECTEARHCTAQAPVCSANRCVGCSTGSDCSAYAATPACHSGDGKCVECTAESFAACKASTPVCDAASQKCVACNVNADCKEATKPICENHLCRACTSKVDCASQSKVCRVETGECVACTPDKDAMQENCSNGKACHPTTFTCTGAARNSLDVCTSCISDSECLPGSRCVATQFMSSPHGTYCLIQPPSSGMCPNRYKTARSATSVLQVTAEYCFPNETFTTCEGIREFGNVCSSNPECGANDLANDALCNGGACTYGCDSDRDCSTSARCFNDVSGSYCKTN
jgi:hypothetical protein